MFNPQIAQGHPPHDRSGVTGDLLSLSPNLNPAIGRSVLRHNEAHMRITRNMTGLDVIGRNDDGKAAVSPFMPDRGQQDSPVAKMGRQDRTFVLVEKLAQFLWVQILPHRLPSSSHKSIS